MFIVCTIRIKGSVTHESKHATTQEWYVPPITKRGRAHLRAVVYMATLSSIRHNRRLKAHYERLTQRATRPLPPMQAIGACMTKLLHYAFAVVKHRTAFDADHVWRDESIAA